MIPTRASPTATTDCWNAIGVLGNATCPELQQVVHCHNCPVYTAAGRGLFERAVPEAYRQEWTDVLAREKDVGAADPLSVFVFRLGAEWLALPTQVCQEVTERCVIRRLPHRSGSILLGLANIRGDIRLCISLSGLLGVEADDEARLQTGQRAYQRLVVIARDADVWVFPVDEVYGLHPCHPGAFQGVPATVAKAPAAYTKGLLDWQGKHVGYLDEALVFEALRRHIS